MDKQIERRNLPIGIQTFEKIRKDNCVYVDKTQFVWELAKYKCPYFLSRPHRFGKSLFLSTLKSYFEGRKDLFEGLAISKTETEWKKYPVLYFDFNGQNYVDENTVNQTISYRLKEYEKLYEVESIDASVSIRFKNLIKSVYEKTGEQVVVLVDEYDKPLLQNVGNAEVENQIRNILKGFYGNLKSEDAFIRFVFITGVTRFDKGSIFSDLNNLNDISMSSEFSAICGISQEEMELNFIPEIENMAEKMRLQKKNVCRLSKRITTAIIFLRMLKLTFIIHSV